MSRLHRRSVIRRRSGKRRRTLSLSLLGGLALVLAAVGITASLASSRPDAQLSRIITPGENLPDPFVLAVNGGYELYASQTSIYGPEVQVAFAKTIGGWHDFTAALAATPVWATEGFTWAPDVRRIQGRYVMYFDALSAESLYFHRHKKRPGLSERAQCIGVALSTAAGGPFVPEPRPLICDFKQHGAIDPRTFVGPGGRLWLDWKSDNNAATPGRFEPTRIFAQPLSSNGLQLSGQKSLLLSAKAPWEGRIVEAPQMVESNGAFFLFFSGGWYNSPSYGIGVARCSGPAGPCRDLSSSRPWLGSTPQGKGPGEESLFPTGNGMWWMMYAPWYFGYLGRRSRPIAISLVGFGPSGPVLSDLPASLP